MPGNLDRCRRDLVTNPAYIDLQKVLAEALRKEGVKLEAASTGTNVAQINTQSGTIQGLRLALKLMENYHKLYAGQKASPEEVPA